MQVSLNNGEWVGDLAEFIKANADTYDYDWFYLFTCDIVRTEYRGGGGAKPEWVLTVLTEVK